MADTRFDGYPVDARFSTPGVDGEHSNYPTDDRFPSPGTDARFTAPVVVGSDAQAVTEFSAYLSPLNGIVSWSITVNGSTIDQDQQVNGEKQSIFDAIRTQIVTEVPAVESVEQNGDIFTASSSTATLTGFQLSYLHTG